MCAWEEYTHTRRYSEAEGGKSTHTYSITAAFQGIQGIQSLLRFSILVMKDGKGVCLSITNHFNHCCVSGYFGCEGLKGCDLFNQLRNDR